MGKGKLASPERAVFLEGLREAAELTLPGHVGDLVRQLLPHRTEDEKDWFLRWSPPSDLGLTREFTASVVANPMALNVLSRFIEFSLPETDVRYPVQEFLRYLTAFGVDFSPSFLRAFDTVVDGELACFNDEVIVSGTLADDASVQHIHARIVALWESIDKWFKGFNEQLSSARECELDVEYSAHLEEEPGEHYGVAEGLAKAYVDSRRDRQGWRWLAEPHNQRFAEAWASVVAEASTTPTADEWDALLKACKDSYIQDYWFAVKQKKDGNRFVQIPRDTFASSHSTKAFIEALFSARGDDSIALLEEIARSLDMSARATVAIATAGMSRSEGEVERGSISQRAILSLLTGAAASTAEAECLEAIYELVAQSELSAIREKLQNVPTHQFREFAQRSQTENGQTAACIAVVCAICGDVDIALLETLLGSSDGDITSTALFAARVGGCDSLLHQCLSHKHYRVRRSAFTALSGSANPKLRSQLVAMADDKSAAVRLEVARTIGERGWPEGATALIKMLSDNRDYNEDSMTGGWPRFEVARAAATSIRQMSLDEETERELREFVARGRKASADPIVRAHVILALSKSNDPSVLDLLFRMMGSSVSIGEDPVPRYVLRCAAAEAISYLLARMPRRITIEQVGLVLLSCRAHDPVLSVRATVAAASAYENTAEQFAKIEGVPQGQAELFICAALANGTPVGREPAVALLGDGHPLLPVIESFAETGAVPRTLPPEVHSWLDHLSAENAFGQASLFYFQKWCPCRVDGPKSPWVQDLEPERIHAISLRSLTGGE